MLRRHEQSSRRPPQSRLELADGVRQFGFEVLIIERQVIDLDETKGKICPPPSRVSACASLRLTDSRRLLPMMTATLNFAIASLPRLRLDTEAK